MGVEFLHEFRDTWEFCQSRGDYRQSLRLSEAVGARVCRCASGNKWHVRKRCSELAEWDHGLSDSRGVLCPELDIWGRSLIYGVTLTANIKQNLRVEWAR